MPTVSPGAPPFWFVPNQSGKPAIGGNLAAYRASAIQEFKPIYQDPAGEIEFENPLPIPTNGALPKIYFLEDEAYRLVFEQADGEDVIIDNNFTPNSGGGGTNVTEYIDVYNHFVNGQFDFPFDIPATLTVGPIDICPKWSFRKSNTNATDTLTIGQFVPGANEPTAWEGTPVNYVNYECTATGAGGETYKEIYTGLCSVLGFAGDEIGVALAGFSPTSSTVQVIARQKFGTGGSPSADVDTILGNFALTASPAKYTATAVLPSISGKVLGTNNDGMLEIIIRYPLNAICNISFTNAQWIHNNVIPEYDHQTHDYVMAAVNGASTNGRALTQASTDIYIMAKPGEVGDIAEVSYEITENTGVYTNWLKGDGRELVRADYPEYNAILAAAGYPWGDGDSSTTFNIYDSRGRSSMGSGTGAGLSPRVVGEMIGEEGHALTADENGAHTHNLQDSVGNVLRIAGGGTPNPVILGTTINNANVGHLETLSSGAGAPHNTVHPVSVVCKIVKVK
jgi:microcystin-dependent protein